VTRTRARVLQAALELLSDQGASAVTYAAVAERAGVSRQTLYNHWPSRDQLFIDLVKANSGLAPFEPQEDAKSAVLSYLQRLAESLANTGTTNAVLAVLQSAVHDPDARTAVQRLVDGSRASLNRLLDGLSEPMTDEDFHRVVGPVVFEVLFARRKPNAKFLASVADSVLDTCSEGR
jgi:AcrR family transcriptional regulator